MQKISNNKPRTLREEREDADSKRHAETSGTDEAERVRGGKEQ